MYSEESYQEALQSQLKNQEKELIANYINQLPPDVRDLLDDIKCGGERKYSVNRIGRCTDKQCADDYRNLSDIHEQKLKDKDDCFAEIERINKRINEELNRYKELEENKETLQGFDK